MDIGHGGYGTSQMPLAGAILCCTSIPPEQRSELAAIGAQMGATIKLDLTSDVTHLIVGNIHSAKYRYVAKSREDVKVLLPEWLDALRTVWMEGEDVDVAALEQQYRLPAFYGLKICLTGFDNPEQRKYIQDTVSQNGAEYHGDLTKSVTHLIAATPSGKKYEHAVNWRMKIVTWEWFEQTRERGMALDANYYHPTIPAEERGRGAWDRHESTSPTLGKRVRDAGQSEMINPLRRKLRRSASSRMGTQSEALWAGIVAPGLERKANDADDWNDVNIAEPGIQVANASTTQSSEATYQDAQPTAKPASHARGPFSDEHDGIFEGRLVFPHGFDQHKTNILRKHLDGNGATVIRAASELSNFSTDDLRRGYLVIPHDVPVHLVEPPEGAGTLNMVTNWWVERCLHGKFIVDTTDVVLCRPFDELNISGFNGLIINSTGFSGIELLHVTKAITLLGATYDEMLSPKISVMICNTKRPNPEKFKFASEKRIPTVHATWLWDTISCGEALPYDDYLLNPIVPQPQQPKQKAQASSAEAPTAKLSKEDSFKLVQKKAQVVRHESKPRAGARRAGALELSLSLSGPPTPASTTGSSTNPDTNTNSLSLDQDAQLPVFDGAGSLPLQDINPSVNSPRRPSTSSNGSLPYPNTKSNSTRSNSTDASAKPMHAQRRSRLGREPTPDSVIPAADSAIPPDTEPVPQEMPKPPEKDYSDIMSKLLANRKTTAPAAKEDANGRRRRRPLGRAQSTRSNASTADDLVSRQSSASRAEEEEASEEAVLLRKPFEPPQPSQELGWDSPGAQRAREKMIRAMGGKVDEGLNVLEAIGVVKDAVTESGIGLGRSSRKRRG